MKNLFFLLLILLLTIPLYSCGPSPKEICFSETAVGLVGDLFAEQYFYEHYERVRSADIFGGLLTMSVAASKDRAIENIKGAFKLSERLEAKGKGDNLYSCEAIFTLPRNLNNPEKSELQTFKISYEVKYSKGEKQDYFTVRLTDKVQMK